MFSTKPFRWFADWIALFSAYGLAYVLRYESGFFDVNQRGDFLSAALLLTASWWLVFALLGHYQGTFAISWWDHARRVAVAVFLGGIALFWLTFEAERPLPPGRFVLLAYAAGIVLFVTLARTFLFMIQRARWRGGKDLLRTAVVGHGKWADLFAEEFSNRAESGHTFVGSIRLPGYDGALPLPELGQFHDFDSLVIQHKLECIVLAWDMGHTEEVLQGIMSANHAKVQVQVVPDLRDHAAAWARLQVRDDLPLLVVKSDFHPHWERLLKRAVGGNNA